MRKLAVMLKRWQWCFPLAASVLALSITDSASAESLEALEVRSLASQEHISPALATHDVQIQNQAGNIAVDLQQKLGREYAGVSFNNQTGQFHIGAVSPAGEAAARAVTDSVGITASSTFDPVKHTMAQLEAIEAALNLKLSSAVKAQEAQVAISPATNSVTVRVASNASVGVIEAAKAPDTQVLPVPPQQLQQKPSACNPANEQCDLPMRGGTRYWSFAGPYLLECTTGFTLRTVIGSNFYMMTAGHCIEAGIYYAGHPTVWGVSNAADTIGYPTTTVEAGHVALGTYGDVAAVSTAGLPAEPDLYFAGKENYYIIKGPKKAYVGLYECHQGKTSGTRCGTVTAVNVTSSIDYREIGYPVLAVEHTDIIGASSQHGDSGGPWAYGNNEFGYGTGIEIGFNESGGYSIAFELELALSEMHLVLAS